MKTYIEKYYKDVVEGEHFWSMEEDCGYSLVEKVKTETGWEWADDESYIVYVIEPESIVWVETQVWGWYDYLIRIFAVILTLLMIAFFCYASWKG